MLEFICNCPASIADLHRKDTEKYKSVLGEQGYKELRRAIGLVSHGIGIGSFVYLRRIFENLIEDAHKLAATDANWDEDTYSQARMDEKIAVLKNHLPAFLVENKVLYAILSKGIHSLGEEECLQHFDVVKTGIELILDERIAERARKQKIEQAKKAIASLQKSLTS